MRDLLMRDPDGTVAPGTVCRVHRVVNVIVDNTTGEWKSCPPGAKGIFS
jgi:hypothetical protein